MATPMKGGPQKGPQVLTQDDVGALFDLISLVLHDPKQDDGIAFAGTTLAAGLSDYREHLLMLMRDWEGLQEALHSDDARQRARALNQELRKAASRKAFTDGRGNVLPIVGDSEAARARHLIRGKGLEL